MAIYYSVIGLAAIFSAAVVAIMVMGAILEVAKLVAAWWLKANWDRAPILLKSYMLISVIVLMLITSMGIFGFLSKAHSDQAITTGDIVSQVALYDEQINVERENIGNAKSLIAQMDATVQGIIASGESREIKLRDGRTYMRSAAEQALQVRRSQSKDRAALTETIEEAQKNILELQQKKAPIASQAREVEAKVGPIKYIAQLIYGEDPDQNLLEKAVTWVIITIVFVFDPLAVLLLLASQMSFQWSIEEKQERKNELVQETTPPEDTGKETIPASQPAVGTVDQGGGGKPPTDPELPPGDDVAEEANIKITEIEQKIIEPKILQEQSKVKYQVLDDADEEIEEIVKPEIKEAEHDDENGRLVAKSIDAEEQDILAKEANLKIAEIQIEQPEFIAPEKATETDQEKTSSDTADTYDNQGYDISADEDEEELEKERSSRNKLAMQAWKAENPNDSLKHQRLLFEQGLIDHLPWIEYLKEEDYHDNEAAVEAAKWAREQVEESKKKSHLDREAGHSADQENQRDLGYQQNAEQTDQTLWQRIKSSKNGR